MSYTWLAGGFRIFSPVCFVSFLPLLVFLTGSWIMDDGGSFFYKSAMAVAMGVGVGMGVLVFYSVDVDVNVIFRFKILISSLQYPV